MRTLNKISIKKSVNQLNLSKQKETQTRLVAQWISIDGKKGLSVASSSAS